MTETDYFVPRWKKIAFFACLYLFTAFIAIVFVLGAWTSLENYEKGNTELSLQIILVTVVVIVITVIGFGSLILKWDDYENKKLRGII